MGYTNPLLDLPAAKKLLVLLEPHPEIRKALADLLGELRGQANEKAETSWRRKKGILAAYWRITATYVRHVRHVLLRGRR